MPREFDTVCMILSVCLCLSLVDRCEKGKKALDFGTRKEREGKKIEKGCVDDQSPIKHQIDPRIFTFSLLPFFFTLRGGNNNNSNNK